MNVILEKDYVKESSDDLITSYKIIDDEGSMYYLEGRDLVFLDFYQDYEEWRETLPIDFLESNATISHLSASFNPKGNLILVGAYLTEDTEDTEENKEAKETREGDTQIEGVVYFEIDGFSKEIKTVEVSKFDQMFIDEFLDKYDVKYGEETEVNDIFNRFQYHFTDSSTVLIGEDAGPANYGDLAVYYFNSEGKLNWAHRIAKRQVRGEACSSYGYFSFLDNENLYVLIQDDEQNLEGNKRDVLDLRAFSNDRYGIPVLYKFNLVSGNKEYDVMRSWKSTNKKLKIYPRYGEQEEIGDPAFIFLKDRSRYQLARITP